MVLGHEVKQSVLRHEGYIVAVEEVAFVTGSRLVSEVWLLEDLNGLDESKLTVPGQIVWPFTLTQTTWFIQKTGIFTSWLEEPSSLEPSSLDSVCVGFGRELIFKFNLAQTLQFYTMVRYWTPFWACIFKNAYPALSFVRSSPAPPISIHELDQSLEHQSLWNYWDERVLFIRRIDCLWNTP